MTRIEWNTTLATGHRAIDLQHQELIELINMLDDAIESRSTQASQQEIVQKLQHYVLFHFSTEDALMGNRNVDSGHIKDHRKEHQSFEVEVARLLNDAEGSTDLSPLLAYLHDWLNRHIVHTDKALAKMLA